MLLLSLTQKETALYTTPLSPAQASIPAPLLLRDVAPPCTTTCHTRSLDRPRGVVSSFLPSAVGGSCAEGPPALGLPDVVSLRGGCGRQGGPFFLPRDRPPILGSVTGQPPSVAANRRRLEFHFHSSRSPLVDPELAQNLTPDDAR